MLLIFPIHRVTNLTIGELNQDVVTKVSTLFITVCNKVNVFDISLNLMETLSLHTLQIRVRIYCI